MLYLTVVAAEGKRQGSQQPRRGEPGTKEHYSSRCRLHMGSSVRSVGARLRKPRRFSAVYEPQYSCWGARDPKCTTPAPSLAMLWHRSARHPPHPGSACSPLHHSAQGQCLIFVTNRSQVQGQRLIPGTKVYSTASVPELFVWLIL